MSAITGQTIWRRRLLISFFKSFAQLVVHSTLCLWCWISCRRNDILLSCCQPTQTPSCVNGHSNSTRVQACATRIGLPKGDAKEHGYRHKCHTTANEDHPLLLQENLQLLNGVIQWDEDICIRVSKFQWNSASIFHPAKRRVLATQRARKAQYDLAGEWHADLQRLGNTKRARFLLNVYVKLKGANGQFRFLLNSLTAHSQHKPARYHLQWTSCCVLHHKELCRCECCLTTLKNCSRRDSAD